MNIDGVRVGVRIIAPYIVHELLARKDAAGEGGHFIQQHELLLRQDGALPVPCDGERVALHHSAAYDKPTVVYHLRPAQQRADAQHHLIYVDGLHHIVVSAGNKAHAHIVKSILGGYHHHRDAVSRGAQGAYKLVPVHLRHHYVGDYQIVIPLVQSIQRFFAVADAGDAVAVFYEHVREQLPELAVILGNKNLEHCRSSPGKQNISKY